MRVRGKGLKWFNTRVNVEELGCGLWHITLVDKCSTKLSGMKVNLFPNTHKPLDMHKSDLCMYLAIRWFTTPLISFEVPQSASVWQSRGAYLGLHPSFIPFKPWSISLGYPFKSRGCPLWTFSCMSCTGLPLLFLHSSGLFHAIHSWRMYSLMNCLKKITRVWSKFANYRECPRSVIATFLKDVKQHYIINKKGQQNLVVWTLCNRFLAKAVDSLRLLHVVMKLITEVNAF